MIRVLIADDHALVRQGMKQILSEHPRIAVAGEATDGQETIDMARRQKFDVAILDISMPGRSGLELLRDLRTERPSMKVIILSMYPEEQYAVRSLRDGASAYITKGSAPDELVQAILTVSRGGRYITPAVAEKLAAYVTKDSDQPPHELLSDREYQVLVSIGAGISVRETAQKLALSAKTVSTYRARILEKMGLKTTVELIRYCIRHGLSE